MTDKPLFLGMTRRIEVVHGENDVIALLVIDMQVGLFGVETRRYDANGVIDRINALGRTVRQNGGIVVFVQHDGLQGDPLESGTDGWRLLSSLERHLDEVVVHKTACDAFYNTDLSIVLKQQRVQRLIITGCATDFCVDSTLRAALSRDYQVVVAADAHTTSDRPHIHAEALIRHHNWLWQNLIHPKVQVEVVQTNDLIARFNNGILGGPGGG